MFRIDAFKVSGVKKAAVAELIVDKGRDRGGHSVR
jgi:hypothetical protein